MIKEILQYTWKRSRELGKQYGFRDGMKHFEAENGMAGAIAVVVAFGGTLITLYLVGLIVGKIGSIVIPNQNPANNPFQLNASWYNATRDLDVQTQSGMSLANILPIAVIGVGILGLVIGGLFQGGQ